MTQYELSSVDGGSTTTYYASGDGWELTVTVFETEYDTQYAWDWDGDLPDDWETIEDELRRRL